MKVGVISYAHPKGLGLVGLTLYDYLSQFCDVEIFPIDNFLVADRGFASYVPTKAHPDWESKKLGMGTLKKWMDEQDVIIVPEVIMKNIINYCNLTRKRYIHIPMQEWVSTNPIDLPYYKRMDAIVCPVNATYDLFSKTLGITDNLYKIRWVLSLNKHPPKKDEDITIFFLNAGTGGVLGRRYVDEQLRAFSEVAKERDDVKLILKTQFALDHPLNDKITYIYDNLPYKDILLYYSKSDVSLCITKWEGIGYHILESLYMGVPVITTNAPPMNEFVKHEENGYLVPAKYPNVSIPIQKAHPMHGLNWVRASLVSLEDMVEAINKGADKSQEWKQNVHPDESIEIAFLDGWKGIINGEQGK